MLMGVKRQRLGAWRVFFSVLLERLPGGCSMEAGDSRQLPAMHFYLPQPLQL